MLGDCAVGSLFMWFACLSCVTRCCGLLIVLLGYILCAPKYCLVFCGCGLLLLRCMVCFIVVGLIVAFVGSLGVSGVGGWLITLWVMFVVVCVLGVALRFAFVLTVCLLTWWFY